MASPAASAPHSSWILRDAIVHASAAAGARAATIAVRGDRILYVGDDQDGGGVLGAGAVVIAGRDLHVYPGFTDAHGHLHSLGRHLEEVDLAGAHSLEEALNRVRARAEALPPGGWIGGRGWSTDEWRDGELPSAAALDGATGGRSAALWRRDGHSLWVTSDVMRRAGIDSSTPAPEGGRIETDEHGAPRGVFVDNAIDLLDDVLPKPDLASLRQRLASAQEALARAGVTGVHDMGVQLDVLGALEGLEASGDLMLRVYAALDDRDEALAKNLGAYARGDATTLLSVRAVKLFADGALGSRGAWMMEPYSDDPGNRGFALLENGALRRRIRHVVDADMQPCIHAIGDAANRAVLDAYEAELGAHHPCRPRIEHAQVVAFDDRTRFAALGVLASMQPVHCTNDMPWARKRLGELREEHAYAWRSLHDAGARLAFGSDFPVETHDPRAGLYAAVTRRAPGGPAWLPNERLRLEEAIAAYTEGAAHARFAENGLGTIAVGRIADLTVFDRELRGDDPEQLLAARVAATVVGGRVVYAIDPGRWGRAAW